MESQDDVEISSTSGKKRHANGKKTREEKRRKFEAKQARQREMQEKEQSWSSWIEANSHFASLVTEEDGDLDKIRSNPPSILGTMLTPYFDIQDSSKSPANLADNLDEELFIAEGTETIRILIQQSTNKQKHDLKPITLKSIFVKPSILLEDPVNLLRDVCTCKTKRKESGDSNDKSPGFHVLVGSEAALSQVAGFPVSRGAMACGVVPKDRDEAWLENLVNSRMCDQGSKKIRLLALDGICDTANLGSMIRCASAFGIDAVVLSNDSCEAWYRRSIRVSMGHIFLVPVVRVESLSKTIQDWTSLHPLMYSFAAVIDTEKLLGSIRHGAVPSSWCCVMGNESHGISPPVAAACTERIRVDMEEGVDSLSVPIACGILLHGLREREGPGDS